MISSGGIACVAGSCDRGGILDLSFIEQKMSLMTFEELGPYRIVDPADTFEQYCQPCLFMGITGFVSDVDCEQANEDTGGDEVLSIC